MLKITYSLSFLRIFLLNFILFSTFLILKYAYFQVSFDKHVLFHIGHYTFALLIALDKLKIE